MKRKHTKTRYALSDATNVLNLPKVMDWFTPPLSASESEKRMRFDRMITIMADNRSELARIYGPRDQTYTGEFRHDVWRIEFEGMKFWVLSAKTKGTGIEIEMPEVWEANHERVVIDFLDNLYTELKELEDDPA